MIALITPTGAREKQIKLCAKFMKAQNYSGSVLWIIIDDALPRTTDFIEKDFRENWIIKKQYPVPPWIYKNRHGRDMRMRNTQARNLMTGIRIVENYTANVIFIIEDDDYYSPRYINNMMEKLNGYDLIGERNTIYYNIAARRWCVNRNDTWSSLFQTAFTSKIIPTFKRLLGRHKFVDKEFFRIINNVFLFNNGNLAIGIKGQPGRPGIGAAHKGVGNLTHDPKLTKLKELIGEDYKYYDNRINSNI